MRRPAALKGSAIWRVCAAHQLSEMRMVPSRAPERGMVSRFFPAQETGKEWCGRGESNPHEPLSSTDFHTVYGFRRPDAAF